MRVVYVPHRYKRHLSDAARILAEYAEIFTRADAPPEVRAIGEKMREAYEMTGPIYPVFRD